MQSKATTPREYLASLPDDRRKAIEAIRKVLKANLDPRIKEGISYGMLGYSVPLSLYPDGYHCNPDQPLPFANLASQKNHMALYLFASYTKPAEIEWLKKAWKAAGKKADIGKSCIRFKSLDDVPLDVVAEAIQRMDVDTFIEAYEKALEGTPAGKKLAAKRKREAEGGGAKAAAPKKKAAKKTTKKVATKKKVAKKPAVKKAATKKATTRKPAAKKSVPKKAAAKKTAKKVSKKAPARAKSAAKPAKKKK